MKPVVCVKCRLFFEPKRNGVTVEEGMPLGNGSWTSYRLWQADLLECPGCGAQLVTGYGRAPIAEHYQSDYEEKIAIYQPLFRVDDC